jgi:hypothetical protein
MTSAKSNAVWLQLGAAFVLFAVTAFPVGLRSQGLAAGNELLEFFESEQHRFSVLTYSQAYVDDEHEKVLYRGTLYAGIHSFALNGCEVVAHVAVEDRFSGAIQHKIGFGRARYEQTGELTDDTVYEYRFTLNQLNPEEIKNFRARPAEFLTDTNFECEEDRSCNFSWVRLVSRDTEMHESRTVNGIQNLSSNVKSIALPVASPQLAAEAVRVLQGAARACTTNK